MPSSENESSVERIFPVGRIEMSLVLCKKAGSAYPLTKGKIPTKEKLIFATLLNACVIDSVAEGVSIVQVPNSEFQRQAWKNSIGSGRPAGGN